MIQNRRIMKSQFSIDKICEECKNPFVAKRISTQYCSHKCNSKAYKKRIRLESIEKQKIQEIKNKKAIPDLVDINNKEILSVAETAILLGIGKTTVYRYLDNNTLKGSQIGRKTFIKRTDIDAMLTNAPVFKSRPRITAEKDESEYYTIAQIKEKYKVKESWIYKIIRENNIPKKLEKGRSYISKTKIDNFFKKNKNQPDSNISTWYSRKEIEKKYDMTPSAIYSLVYEKQIPKKREGRNTLYSQVHFDKAKNDSVILEQDYYTISEAIEKYKISKNSLYNLIRYHKLANIKQNRNIKILKSTLDTILNKPVQP